MAGRLNGEGGRGGWERMWDSLPRGFWHCIRLPPTRLLGASSGFGNWVQGGPRGCSVRSLKPRSGEKGSRVVDPCSRYHPHLRQPGNPPSLLSLCSRNFQLRLARCARPWLSVRAPG